MNYRFDMPTTVYFGEDSLNKNKDKLILGKRALVLTGANSGRKSGALADVEAALAGGGASYEVFEGIGNNPNIEQCRELGEKARSLGADFIVGIGGGSPLDASKAVAVFAKNDISEEELFKNSYNEVLPIAAVPTTSGTGSEVTPWSIMTCDSKKTKVSFGSHSTFPKVSFLDPRYTLSLPREITFDTAMDAFQHCFESLMSLKATPVTDSMNINALRLFKKCMRKLEKGDCDPLRDRLMTVSMLGGMTIAQTGTTLMHAMGYPLTYFRGIPHGRANCMVMPAYLEELSRFNPRQLKVALTVLDMDKEELISFVCRNVKDTISADDEELMLWAEQTSRKNPMASTGTPGEPEHLFELFKKVMSGAGKPARAAGQKPLADGAMEQHSAPEAGREHGAEE